MNKSLLALYGLKWNPFSPELPTEALMLSPKVEDFFWRIEQNQPLIATAYFFGSRVRGDHTDNSDLDIAIRLTISDPLRVAAPGHAER